MEGIPCTTVARTIVDLADREPRRNVERLIDQAEIQRAFDLVAIGRAIARANGRRGGALVRAILADYEIGEGMTRNRLEEALFGICDRFGLPRPAVNVWIPYDDGTGAGAVADFAWSEQKVIAETDGRASHGTRRAFEEDRARDRKLALAEWRVLRFTWREVFLTPSVVARDLRSALRG